jgi:hypothetical protein
MMPRIFFIVHDDNSFENHPNLIGFGIKTDLDKKPIRDTKGKVIADNSLVSKIEPEDTVIYYTLGDYSVRGIFKVKEKLEEGDVRRAKDWSPSTIEFLIEPIITPKNDIDFRNIIFSGKEPLNMFRHLENLKKQWGMSVGGKNYIREIDAHDYQIIKNALEANGSIEIETPIEVPEFPREHLANQFRIVKILKSYGLKVHVARNDKAKIKEKGEDVMDSIVEFHTERICDIASRIDCIGFSENDVPRIVVEIVDSLGTLTESLYRMNEIALVYPRSDDQKFYIIGPEKARNDFSEKIDSSTFRSLRNRGCSFYAYGEVEQIFQDTQKKRSKL